MSDKKYSIPEVKGAVAKAIKERVSAFEATMLALKKAEIEKCGDMSTKKSDKCPDCGQEECECERAQGTLPSDKKAKDESPKDSGSGGEKQLDKADVPMSKPPTKKPSSMPKSSGGSPSVGMAKSEGTVARLRKSALEKAGPRLGGKDDMSQAMTQHAAMAGAAHTSSAPESKGTGLTPEDHAARAASYADFTPKASATAKPTLSGAAGDMKPSGTAGLKAPTPKVGKVQGTSVSSSGGGLLSRFTAALKGSKAQ